MVRAITWWMPGMPFADGGPSKNTKRSWPSRVDKLFEKISCSSQYFLISSPKLGRLSPLYSLYFICLIFFLINNAYLTVLPSFTFFSGCISDSAPSAFSAMRTMPWDSTPLMFLGARLISIRTCLPTRSSGW